MGEERRHRLPQQRDTGICVRRCCRSGVSVATSPPTPGRAACAWSDFYAWGAHGLHLAQVPEACRAARDPTSRFPRQDGRELLSPRGPPGSTWSWPRSCSLLDPLGAVLLARGGPPALSAGRAAGPGEFQEAELFARLVTRLRRAKPDLGIKILLERGSFRRTCSDCAPCPVTCSGSTTPANGSAPSIRPRNPIHGDIATAAREGHWVSLCNALRGIPGRPTALSRIHANIGHALDAGLKGLDGMSTAIRVTRSSCSLPRAHVDLLGPFLDETLR